MAATISRRPVPAGTAAGAWGAAIGPSRAETAGAAPTTGIKAVTGVTVVDANGVRRDSNARQSAERRELFGRRLLPAQALRAATLEPARHLGRRDHGAIGRGKVADLVLPDADPLRDIGNTARIDSVFTRGRLIDAATQRRMPAEIEAAAQRRAATGTVPVTAGCPCR